MCTYPSAQTLPCASTATCCANPQSQYHHPQLGALKFAQLSIGIFGVCGSPLPSPMPQCTLSTGKELGCSPCQLHTGSSCFPALRAKAPYKQFVPFTSSASPSCSLCRRHPWVSVQQTHHILAEIRSQSSQVGQSISGPFHLGFAPRSCQLQMQWDNRSLSLSHSHTQGNLSKPSHHEAGSHEEP